MGYGASDAASRGARHQSCHKSMDVDVAAEERDQDWAESIAQSIAMHRRPAFS